jgi:short-subunit dehydrogenase
MSALDLRGRSVVLTGASGGIGAALTAEFVAAGARVIAVGRDLSKLQRLAAAYPRDAVVALAADVATDAGREAIATQAHAQRASLLVIAHAQPGFGMFEAQDPAALQRMIDTNLSAPMLLLHALLPALRAQARADAPAAVVAVGSTFGSLAYPGFAAYSAGKFGLRGLIEGLRREYADSALRFQYLAPRATRTAFNSAAVDAMNRELNVAQDAPEAVAKALRAAIERGAARRQLGWPEAFFVRLNALLPGAVDRSLKAQLPVVRRHAVGAALAAPTAAAPVSHPMSPALSPSVSPVVLEISHDTATP